MNINDILAEGLRDPKDNPCWKGYHPVGTKEKNGRTVPNCVPNANEGLADFSNISTSNSGSHEFRGVHIPGNMKHPDWNEPTWSFKEIADKLGVTTNVLNNIAFKIIGGFPEAVPGLKSRYGSKKYYKKSDVKRWVNSTNVREIVAKLKQRVAEDFDGEYDDEAGMAHTNLVTIARAAQGLLDTIDQHENLPEWVQEKIARVEGMLVTAWDYLKSQEAQGIDPRIAEMYQGLNESWQRISHRVELNNEFNLIENFVNDLAARYEVSTDYVWEDLESLTDDELYVFAVTSEPVMEDWQKVNKKDKTDGMSKKAVAAYRREHPGSKLKTAVTTKPSKLKKGSKASKRRKSYCSRSKGQMDMHNISCAKTPDKAICKARRRWNC